MTRTEAIQHSRELLRAGDTEAALQHLDRFISDKAAQHDLHLLTARFNTLRQQQTRQIVDPEVAQRAHNQINNDLLHLLDTLEKGAPTGSNVARRWPLWIGIVLFSILAGAGMYWWTAQVPEVCAKFEENKRLKVLIGPMTQVGGSNKSLKPAALLQSEINKKTQIAKIPTQVVLTDLPTEEVECADWIITGEYATYGSDSLRIRLSYRSGKSSAIQQQTEFQGLSDITQMEKLRSLTDVVNALCAKLARTSGQNEFAEKWLQQIIEKEKSDNEL
jgi:Effector-associated domain 11